MQARVISNPGRLEALGSVAYRAGDDGVNLIAKRTGSSSISSLTVDPVPTPRIVPGLMNCSAACAASRFLFAVMHGCIHPGYLTDYLSNPNVSRSRTIPWLDLGSARSVP